jgi:hypothetical protein
MIQEFLFAWAPWIYNKIYDLQAIIRRASWAAYSEIMIPKQWIFLKDVLLPFPRQMFPDVAELRGRLRWVASTVPPRFLIEDISGQVKESHLDYLSFVVKQSDTEQADLTEWINDVRYTGRQEPSPADIFALWCCVTGHPYFHWIDTATVTYLDEMGDEKTEELKGKAHTPSNGSHITPDVDSHRSMDFIFSSSGC